MTLLGHLGASLPSAGPESVLVDLQSTPVCFPHPRPTQLSVLYNEVIQGELSFFFLLGGGFEWDDDFSPDPFMSKTTSNLLSSKPSLQTSKYFSPPPPPRSTEQSWPHTPPYSRFSISPANIASFSLTHLTDSDIEQGGERRAGCQPVRPSLVDLHAY